MTTTEITLTIIMGVWLVGFILLAMSCNRILKQRDKEREKNDGLKKSELRMLALLNRQQDEFKKLKSKYEELKREYDLQKAENVTLAYINEKIGGIAKAKCPEIAAFLERMKLMREQAIKDMTERAKENAEEE